MKKLLWIGDGPDCPSGFGRATREILDTLRYTFDVTVLGINYRGDPGTVPYPVYAAAPGGDAFGVGRLVWMVDVAQPDVIVIQQDGWNIPPYIHQLRKFPEHDHIPVVAAVAVDGKNFNGKWLDGVTLAIFWTDFAAQEARLGGYEGPLAVIPLGVDRTVYFPEPQHEARRRRLPEVLWDAFIIGNVNRNQPRKRWDLTVKFFAEWVKRSQIDDAYLYMHTAPTGDLGTNVKELARYYGVLERLALMEPPTWYGIPEAQMRETYNCFDVCITTTQGEGFGLPTLEAMACGIPVIAPDWSALGDWAVGAVDLIPCPTTLIGPPYVNVIGGIPDQGEFVAALDRMYMDKYRKVSGKRALVRASEERFSWNHIGEAWASTLEQVLHDQSQDGRQTAGEQDQGICEKVS